MTAGSVWAVSMMRDEADVAADVVRHFAAEGVDGIIVADNRSADGTGDLLRSVDVSCELIVVDDPDPAYHQSQKMTHLARLAAERGADWIVPFDADEVWFGSDRVAEVLRAMPEDVAVVEASIWNHFATALDTDDPCPFRSMVYRHTDVGALPKVAFRWHADALIHQGNHGVDRAGARRRGLLSIRHFPYRSFAHFMRKARNGAEAYAATDLPVEVGAHWRQYGELLDRYGEDALREVWSRWFWFLSPTDSSMVHDPAPFMRWE